MLVISREVLLLIKDCEMLTVAPDKFGAKITAWQEQIRNLKPSWRFVLPWGQI
jgi:hypothetical protein